MTDRPAVSVVVPVFSPGPYLRPLLDCLDRQITPEDGFEALFVDDGSTDTTPDLLKRWSAPRPWAHVIPLARSGWPSRPRNVGLERARGEFVFFVDHDDWLAHDALARMTAFARAHGSDVVVGWMRGLGRNVPVRLFAETVADAHPPATPLQDSMTVHALFRTEFLRQHGIRFDESLRRLEDHLFMAAAYTSARRVSVLADAPVYLHAAREDGENAGHRPYEAAEYYAALGRAVDTVIGADVPSAERDAYLGRWMRGELLHRLRSEAIVSLPPGERDAFFLEAQRLLSRMPAEAVTSLPQRYRKAVARVLRSSPADYWDDERAGAADDAPHSWSAAIKAARTHLVDALSRRGPRRLRHRVVRWGRNPYTMLRDAGAALAVVSAVIAAVVAVAAPLASVALVALSTSLTAWLAVRSLSPWPTATRQVVALGPALVVAVVRNDISAAAVALLAACLVAIAAGLDLFWRRRDVRGYPARRGGPLARLGWIGLLAAGMAGAITSAVAIAVWS